MNQFVYIVQEHYGSGGCLHHGVFSDKKRADELAKKISENIDYKYVNNHIFVEKYFLD